MPTIKARFELGLVVATPGALRALEAAASRASTYVTRHVSGDFGEVHGEDKEANEQAMMHGERILSAYTLSVGERLWIITEADRSVTTLLLAHEY